MFEASVLSAFKALAFAFVALFPVVNPIGDAPIFLSLTRHYPDAIRRVLARKIAFYGFLLLAGSMALGSRLLEFFGITITTVQMAGGMVLAHTGWTMLNQSDTGASAPSASTRPATLEVAMENAFYPLTLPLTVGPGCISLAITLGAHIRRENTTLGQNLPHFVATLAGMFLVCLLVWVCYANADRMVKALGTTATNIITRLSSFVLLSIGVQIFWNGFTVAITPVLQIFAR
jgi:multiple antibiotic resistance protein